MKRRLLVVLLVVVLFILIGNRVWRSSKRPDAKSISQLQSERGVPVVVYTANRGEISESVELPGTVQGIAQSTLISRITERVTRVHVAVGQKVRKGEILVALDVGSPMAQYRQAKAALGDAEKNLSRMKALFEEGAISRQMFEQAESGLEIARANFEAASALVEIVSPIAGVVTSVNVHEGEVVHTGSVVCTVARADSVKIVADVSPSELEGLEAGDPAMIEETEKEKIPGQVYSISSSADPHTRTFRVELIAANRSGSLKPGSFVTAKVLTSYKNNALVIPLESISSSEAGPGVFLITDSDRSELRPVRIGITNDKFAEILDGIEEGDRVIRRGHELLTGGEKLKIVETE
jgi:RND family efflux transporter MFP subunit